MEERSTGDRGRKARLESIAEVFPTCRRGNHVPERIEALGADLSYAKREGHIIALLIAIRGAGGKHGSRGGNLGQKTERDGVECRYLQYAKGLYKPSFRIMFILRSQQKPL